MKKTLYNILEFLTRNAHSLFFFLSSLNKWYTDAILLLLRRPNGRKYMESDAYRGFSLFGVLIQGSVRMRSTEVK